MSRWDKGVAAMAVVFGLCCLFTAATGLSTGSSWLPAVWRGPILDWAPLACVAILALLVGTLLLPSVPSFKFRAASRPALLIVGAAMATMVLYYIYRG